jgi:hypothetical protein
MLNNNHFRKKAFATFIGLLCCLGPIGMKAVDLPRVAFTEHIAAGGSQSENNRHKDWTKVYSFQGKCNAMFPRNPDHVKQNMEMKGESSDLEYDVYVADLERRSVFMVLIAKYPGEVKEEYAVGSLEHFLNTILVQNPNNQLVFANLVHVQGFQGMDFFIRTNDVYFKGRVLLAKNYLYLLAMECEKQNYQDEHYQFFIQSFELVK